MPKRFLVNSSPHYRSETSTRSIMLDMIIAMLPILAVSAVYFGLRTVAVTVVSVGGCIAFESLFNAVMKRENTVGDLSAVVTGMLLAFCLPAAVPYWLVIAGDAFAIVVVKMLFGGIGKNFANPALAARAFLNSWPKLMLLFTAPLLETALPILRSPAFTDGVTSEYLDSVTAATPLASLKIGAMPAESIWDLFVGNKAGCLGETCVAAILLGGIYLLLRRVITWHIPVAYIGTVAVITFVFPLGGGYFDVNFMLAELCSGGLMLAAFFMATDYSTSPITKSGRLIYGVGCGLLTVFLRYYSGSFEGVTYAVLLMNVLAFGIDKITKPKRYGIGGGYHVGTTK